MYDFSSFPAAILFFQVMESMDDFNNTTIDLVDLENMGVPVGISLISCTVHEICSLLTFPGPPSCFPGPGERRMSEICHLGTRPPLHGIGVGILLISYVCRELYLLLFIHYLSTWKSSFPGPVEWRKELWCWLNRLKLHNSIPYLVQKTTWNNSHPFRF